MRWDVLQVAVAFAEMHDTPARMVAKGVLQGVVPWAKARSFLATRLRRRCPPCILLFPSMLATLLDTLPASEHSSFHHVCVCPYLCKLSLLVSCTATQTYCTEHDTYIALQDVLAVQAGGRRGPEAYNNNR